MGISFAQDVTKRLAPAFGPRQLPPPATEELQSRVVVHAEFGAGQSDRQWFEIAEVSVELPLGRSTDLIAQKPSQSHALIVGCIGAGGPLYRLDDVAGERPVFEQEGEVDLPVARVDKQPSDLLWQRTPPREHPFVVQ
ncbi:hypothetical protein C8E83_2960 [Frondihabitans australicus]|uniref:Uncharacterized protein n=1 Tax=Frondihabitans australicus TaxID=386892 RepID=A0A495III6_9MICO|nr:hypothetical protein C8E83_2960 [Frondihabitans australicus]